MKVKIRVTGIKNLVNPVNPACLCRARQTDQKKEIIADLQDKIGEE